MSMEYQSTITLKLLKNHWCKSLWKSFIGIAMHLIITGNKLVIGFYLHLRHFFAVLIGDYEVFAVELEVLMRIFRIANKDHVLPC